MIDSRIPRISREKITVGRYRILVDGERYAKAWRQGKTDHLPAWWEWVSASGRSGGEQETLRDCEEDAAMQAIIDGCIGHERD